MIADKPSMVCKAATHLGDDDVPPIARVREWVPPEARPVYAAVLALTAIISAVVLATDFRFDVAVLGVPLGSLAILAVCGIHLRCNAGKPRLGSAVQGYALFMAISVAAPLCAVIVASTGLPLIDAELAHLDRALFFGFERRWVVDAIVTRPIAFEAAKFVYHSLIWQPALLLAVLFANDPPRAWTLLLAWAMTLATIVAIFPFVPAAGEPPYFLDFIDTFTGARDGSLRVLGREALTGIITFPSFHAAAGVLLAWGFASSRRLRVPFGVLNAVMIASALIAGHYLIDLFAGAIVAGVSIVLCKAIQRRLPQAG
jgi:PAP2 superfamily